LWRGVVVVKEGSEGGVREVAIVVVVVVVV
jgi:hypothetical protein